MDRKNNALDKKLFISSSLVGKVATKKIFMEDLIMPEFASKGVAGTGLGLGIAGTTLGLMNGGLGRIFGNGCNYNNDGGCCSDDRLVNRYDLNQAKTIAEKDSEIALLKSEGFTNNKIADVFERLNVRLVELEKDTEVNKQRINDNLAFINNRIDNEYDKLKCYVDAHYVPGKLIMPLDSICPPAMPLCPEVQKATASK